MPGRSMNVLTVEVIEELTRWSTRSRPTLRSKARWSPRARRASRPAPTSRCCRAWAATTHASPRPRAKRRRCGFSSTARASFRSPTEARDLRQTFRRGDQRRMPRRRLRTRARLPLPDRRRQRKARVGLPEIKVGLFPGAGGTQRVPRLAPTPDALQMMFRGELLRPAAAKAMGLVHVVAPAGEIVALAKAWVKANQRQGAVGRSEIQDPSGKVFSAGGMMIWPPANAIYRRETYDNYPAAKAILSSVFEGLQLPIDLGAGGREPLLRQDPALEGSGGDDPLAVHLQGRTRQGRAPARRLSRRAACARSASSAPA